MDNETTPADSYASRLHNLSPHQLVTELNVIESAIKSNQGLKAEVQAEIDRRWGATLDDAQWVAGAATGTFTVNLMDNVSVKREVKKEVKYDSEGLLKIMAGMTWDQVSALFKLTVSVPEKVYAGLAANPELKTRIDACRTVTPKVGPVKLIVAEG